MGIIPRRYENLPDFQDSRGNSDSKTSFFPVK
jgi:hypothetical protein